MLLSRHIEKVVKSRFLYVSSNHLGNVLTVVSDRKIAVETSPGSGIVDHFIPDIVSATDYYAFGGQMSARSWAANSSVNGFNGKRKDLEGMGGGGTTYDYGFRIYNPNLGRFLSVDPLTTSYPWYTPYQFAGNMPIWAIDLDGLEEYIVTKTYAFRNNKIILHIKVTYVCGVNSHPACFSDERRESSPGAGDKNRKADTYINGILVKSGEFQSTFRLAHPNTVDNGELKRRVSYGNGYQDKSLKEGYKGTKQSNGRQYLDEEGETVFLASNQVFYANNSAENSIIVTEALNKQVFELLTNPELRANIVGYTSRKGDASANQDLSERRAMQLVDKIVQIAKDMGANEIEAAELRTRLNYSGDGENRAATRHPDDLENNSEQDRTTEVNIITP